MFLVLEKKGLYLINNTFINNIGKSEGGAIKWQGIEPYLESNVFINNSAVYGNIIAAFPYIIEMSFTPQTHVACKNNLSDQCYLSLSNIASGAILNFSFEFVLKDVYNQTCYSVNNQLKKYFLLICVI